ncbi:recombinase family protein, partial [Nesterenkonia sp. CF4.4]|uniref:recombinase family protein n=1 Tax=Nesterenkonia sp. CF4.4 TaxID=3373079 RepID=UPI003EE60BCA
MRIDTAGHFGDGVVPTKDKQDDDLQRRAVIDIGVGEELIYADQVSGSKEALARSGWTNLDGRLREGDALVVWRIDRIRR